MSIEQRLEQLEKRLRVMEDIDEIRNLKQRYCFYTDIWGKPGQLKEFGELFTDDGEWDIGQGIIVGPAAITAAETDYSKNLKFAPHLAMNPTIEVDGDTATGIWHAAVPLVFEGTADIGWIFGTYHESYVRTPKGWRFRSVKLRSSYTEFGTLFGLSGKGVGTFA